MRSSGNVGPTELAFWSAIQPELILKHEYLSHFAPRHPDLSSSVREGWLMDALIDEVDRNSVPERPFDVGVFSYLRDHAESSLSQYSNPGARELPYRIRRTNVELYWDITRAIVSLQPGEIDRVGRIDELLDALVELSRTELEDLIEKGQWAGFRGFLNGLPR